MKRRVVSLITMLALCLNLFPAWAMAADGGTGGGLCPHHQEHTDECGYVQEDPGAPCAFVCKICLINDLISKLPGSASMDSMEQSEAQLSEIYDLYNELTGDEQQQVNFSPCVSLLNQAGEAAQADAGTQIGSDTEDYTYRPNSDKEFPNPHKVPVTAVIDTNGFTLTWPLSTAIQVTETGRLYLKGRIISRTDIGVEVKSGGFLSIEDSDTVIVGSTCALDIASGAVVRLSGGTFTGKTSPAIRIQAGDGENADFAALLEPGYAYFDTDGTPILPADAAQKMKVSVGRCTDHSDKNFTLNPGTAAHTWTCTACGTEEAENCTFSFDQQSGTGTCVCGNSITIAVDRGSLKVLAYDETIKPANGGVTVTVNGAAAALVQGADYTVSYSTRANVGSTAITVTVTVDGTAYHGSFTESYTFSKEELAPPALQWNTAAKPVPVTVNYDGEPVEAGDLPPVKINIASNEGLDQYLRYFYRKQGETAYTKGLPTNAGTYDVVVSLPEMEGVYAVSSEPVTLTIKKLNPVSKSPAAKNSTYSGNAQELVTRGELHAAAAADGAVILFATSKTGNYSTEIPTGTTASSNYKVWYKVEETDNCAAAGPTEISISISRKTITPRVDLSRYTYQYDGGEKQPAVTVTDTDNGRILPDSEYAVTYENNRNAGTATVKVTNKSNGNYNVNAVNVPFTITRQNQAALSITKQPDTVTYGDKFTLGTSGGSGNGNVTWEITSGTAVARVDPNSGQVTVIGDGQATVKATKSGTDAGVTNYEPATASWMFTADKKPVAAVVTAEDKAFDGNKTAAVHAVVEQGVLSGDEITITGLTGRFEDENVGKDKKVTVDTNGAVIGGRNSEHYDVSYSSLNVTASISKAAISIGTAPAADSTLIYDKASHPLLTSGAVVVTGIPPQPIDVPVEYALRKDGPYSPAFPEAVSAGPYTVWYKVTDSVNYTGIAAAQVEAEIAKATPEIVTDPVASSITSSQPLSASSLEGNNAGGVPGSFAWANEVEAPVSGTSYDVIFTPDDTANYNRVTIQIPVTVSDGSTNPGGGDAPEMNYPPVMSMPSAVNAASSAPMKTTVRNGTASTVLNTANGSKLVEEAAANHSQNVVIKPEITSGVTKAEVSIPASTVRQLESGTDAALTVSTPIADVTLPNAALRTLSSAGGTVDVVTEQVERGVALTLTADGRNVENVSGGLTLTVPVEDAAPGTVAVLVSDDGTRETLRKSIVEDDKIRIPLSGSATVEIVDNSKDFTDVPSTSWASDAVAFASARELFNGTSETTFSPDQPMSRGMLATVLYNLEGRPEQELTGEFRDVSSDAWYADGVSWATANGITNGYGNGQFGPDDNVTREQFIVMLWKYAGSPAAGGGGLGFTDADQASSYALEALNWAVENGILNGYGNGQLDPCGVVTRAQAAQLLKNLMENT